MQKSKKNLDVYQDALGKMCDHIALLTVKGRARDRPQLQASFKETLQAGAVAQLALHERASKILSEVGVAAKDYALGSSVLFLTEAG